MPSEVAQLLEQIKCEYESAMLGMSGLAEGTSRHNFINAKMNHMGELVDDLSLLIGQQQAWEQTIKVIN